MEKEKQEASFFEDYNNLITDGKRLEKDTENPFFKSKYIQLKDVLAEAKRLCLANNFIFIQHPSVVENKNVLTTTLYHKSGKMIVSNAPLLTDDINNPQKTGAAITYMRRYSLTAILGIEEEDDDGNFVTGNKTKEDSPF